MVKKMKEIIPNILILISICNTSLFAQWKSFDFNTPSGGYVNFIFAEDNHLLASASEEGVYESFDSGSNWRYTGLKEPIFEVLDFAKNDTFMFAASTHGFFKKRILDDSWELVDSSFNGSYNDVEVQDSNVFLINTYEGFFKSSDNGKTWYQMDSVFNQAGFRSLTVQDSTIFVSTYEHIYKSNDLGLTWTVSDSGIGFNGFNSLNLCDSIITCLTSLNGAIISKDLGKSWNPIDSSKYEMRIQAQRLIGRNLFFATHYGIFKYSIDSNIIKDISYNLPNINTFSISENDSFLFVSTENGVYKSYKDSENWISCNNGLNAIVIEDFARNEERLFACSFNYGLFISDNKGGNWKLLQNEINQKRIYAVFANEGSVLVGTDFGLYLSRDNGQNWELVSDLKAQSIILVDTTIYAGGFNGFLFSKNNGFTWEKTNYWWLENIRTMASIGKSIFLGINLKGVIVYENDSAFVRNDGLGLNGKSVAHLVAIDSTIYNITYTESYVSKNLGRSWEPIDLQEFGGIINTSTNIGDNYFIGTQNGIYQSNDKGVNWEAINDGNKIHDVKTIFVDNFNLYASAGGKIWQKPLTELLTSADGTNRELNHKFVIHQNYPNPFNPITNIDYSIPYNCFVTIKIYDLLGREMTTLVNELKTSGYHKLEFDGRNLTSGIYFYRINAGNFLDIKKFILLK